MKLDKNHLDQFEDISTRFLAIQKWNERLRLELPSPVLTITSPGEAYKGKPFGYPPLGEGA